MTSPTSRLLAASRRVTLALLLAGLAPLGIGPLAIGPEPAHSADPPARFDVLAGERLTVTLPSNRTTGYQWQLGRPPDERVLRLVGMEYVGPERDVPGAGGQEVWTFEAVAPGTATIRLNYVRPWERNAPAGQSRVFEVLVR